MAKFPLIDLAYGRYITVLFDSKEDPSNLAHRTTAKVKARNQFGSPDILTDLPEGSLRYIPPKHAKTPRTGVFVLFAGTGGVSVIGDEVSNIKGEVFEKMTAAQTKADALGVAKEIESKMQLDTTQETISKQIEIAKDIKESQQFSFPFANDYRQRADELINK